MKQKFTIQSEPIFYNNETINILYLDNKITKYTLYQKENETDTYDESLFKKFEFDDSFQIAPKKKFSNIIFLFFKDDSTNMFQLKYNNKFLYYQVNTSINFIYNSTMNVLQADGSLYTKKNTLTKTLNIFDNTPVVKENSVEKLIENELNYANDSLLNQKTSVENIDEEFGVKTVVEEPIMEKTFVEELVEVPVVEELVVKELIIEVPIVEEPVIKETIVEVPVVEELVIKETIVEVPIVEEQVVEEHVVKETVVEEPIIEEHVVVEETVVIEKHVVEEPIIKETVVVEETVVEKHVVEEPVIEHVVEEKVSEIPVIEKPVEDTSNENLKHKKVTFKETDDNKNNFTFKNIIEDFIILDKAISKSIEEKINIKTKVNLENKVNQTKIIYNHNNINYNLYSTKLTPIKPNTNLNNEVIDKTNIFTNYDNAIELDNKNMNYLILFNKTKYLVNKKDTVITFINLQNKNIITVNNKEYFKLENVNYLLTNNSSLIIPVENKKVFDNNNGTSYNVLIPKTSI
jgi:hypothetical protein